jgi:hypothetical protein
MVRGVAALWLMIPGAAAQFLFGGNCRVNEFVL